MVCDNVNNVYIDVHACSICPYSSEHTYILCLVYFVCCVCLMMMCTMKWYYSLLYDGSLVHIVCVYVTTVAVCGQ